MHAAVIHTAGVAGQVGAASFNNLGVHFHQVNALHTVIAGQFPHNAAIARMANRVLRLRDGRIVEDELNESPVAAAELDW
mgnify:FL=1